MLEVNADLGIGFDGDGDRLGIIDKQGRPVPGDLLTAFLSNAIVKNKDKTIILDIKSSQVAYNKIIENGFKVEIWKTGHSHIKKRMKEINSPLAGEMSGHIFFAEDYYGYDDALYASIKLLELVTKNHNLEDFISALPITFPSPEIKVTCSDNIKFNIVEKILKQTLVDYSSNDVIELDGVRVNNKCGWWLIRASNTEAVLVIRVEGTSEENKKMLLIEVQKRLKNAGLTWELP
jgi:phosphomannomutase